MSEQPFVLGDIFDPDYLQYPLDLDVGEFRILRLVNFNELFSQNTNAQVINNSHLVTDNLSKNLTSSIFRESDSTVSFVAECQCGHLKGNFNQGVTCPKCNTKVSEAFVNTLQHDAWLSIPDDIFAPVLNPIFYMILKKNISYKKNIALIDLILNTSLPMPDNICYFPRGFKNFYNQFDHIFSLILDFCNKNNKKKLAIVLNAFVQKYRDCIFTTKLPVLNSALHTITSEGKSLKYVDQSVKDVLAAIINLTHTAFIYKRGVIADSKVESDFYKVYIDYIEYLKSILVSKLGSKFGLVRRHLLISILNLDLIKYNKAHYTVMYN
jgi:hypothetical protein